MPGLLLLGQGCGAASESWRQLTAEGVTALPPAASAEPGGSGAAGKPLAVLRPGGGFTVRVLPESLLDHGAVERWTAHCNVPPGTAELELTLQVTGARGLKALLLELEFDGGSWHPADTTVLPVFGAAQDIVCYSHGTAPGLASTGAVLRQWDQRAGFSGDGAVLLLRFMPGAQPQSRTSSAPPALANSQARLVWDAGAGQLSWYYANCGDYNQNGVVGLTDLVPLALYLGETGPANGYPETSERSVIDGNGDHRISLADLAPIGANWGAAALGGYNIYASADPQDYPAAGVAPQDAKLWQGQAAFAAATAGVLDRKHFTFALAAPSAGEYYWVRPADGALDGMPSTLAHHAASAPGGWSMLGHDAQQTCRSEYSGPATATLKWAFAPPGSTGHFAQPVVDAAGTIYCCESGDLLAIQPTGAESWRASIASPSIPAVAADGSIISLATAEDGTGCICALNADGSVRWISASYNSLHPPAVCPDGTVLAASQTKQFRVLNPDGTVKWSFDTAWNAVGRAAYGPDGTIYLLCANILYALSPLGQELWQLDISWSATKAPLVGPEGMIYLVNDYSLIAVYPDGKARYQYKDPAGMMANFGPAVGADGTAYFASSAGTVYAVSHTGSLLWKYVCGSAVQAAPVVAADGGVYIGTKAGVVHAIAADGTARWTCATAGEIATSPVCAPNGSIYVANVAGLLYALDHSGNVLWTIGDQPGVYSGIVLAADGTSYFTSAGHLLAVDALGRPKWTVADTARKYYATPAVVEDGRILAPDYGSASQNSIRVFNPDGSLSAVLSTPGNLSVAAPWIQSDGSLLVTTSSSINQLSSALTWDWTHEIDKTGSYTWNAACGGTAGMVYYACGNSYYQKKSAIHALDAAGVPLWTYYRDASNVDRMACGAGGVVYLLDRNTRVYALDADGNPLSDIELPATPLHGPAIAADGTLYVVAGGQLLALDPQGAVKWQSQLGEPVLTELTVDAGGNVYAGTTTQVASIDPQGAVRWSYPTGPLAKDVETMPVLGMDGTLYYAGGSGHLYALQDP